MLISYLEIFIHIFFLKKKRKKKSAKHLYKCPVHMKKNIRPYVFWSAVFCIFVVFCDVF